MKAICAIVCLVSSIVLLGAGTYQPLNDQTSDNSIDGFRSIRPPIQFVPNYGQFPKGILYKVEGTECNSWVTRTGLLHRIFLDSPADTTIDTGPGRYRRRKIPSQTAFLRMTFLGANPDASSVPQKELLAQRNYFLGNDPKEWITHVPAYDEISVSNAYPGVNIKYYGRNGHLEYDVVVAPGASPSLVRMKYDGVDSLRVVGGGRLQLYAPFGDLTQAMPEAFQVVKGKKAAVAASYKQLDATTVGFAVSSAYDHSLPLCIDPILLYGTYLGGSSDDFLTCLSVDSGAGVYMAGTAYSNDFPVDTFIQRQYGGSIDAVICKFDLIHNELVYSTYLGGSYVEAPAGLAVSVGGEACVVGSNRSTDFPQVNSTQSRPMGPVDAFVTKLNRNGDSLIFSTLLGGGSYDWGDDVDIDAAGNIVVVGLAESSDFPVDSNAYSPTIKSDDAFIVRYDSAGHRLQGTFLGGTGSDAAVSVALDQNTNIYVAGYTTSLDFPTANPIQAAGHGTAWEAKDFFISKFSPLLDTLLWSTYLGGSGVEDVSELAVDRDGGVYVTGTTTSSDFPLQNPISPAHGRGGVDGFVSKISTSPSRLVYSTYFGGEADDYCEGICLDTLHRANIIGFTSSPDLPLVNPIQNTFKGYITDAFVATLKPSGSAYDFLTYLGGKRSDQGRGIACNRDGNILITGETYSYDFPTLDPLQPASAGSYDAFIAEIGEITTSVPPDVGPSTLPMTFAVYPNRPNPFNGSTTISYDLPRKGRVKISIYDILGQRVSELINATQVAGNHSATWTGCDSHGREVASGLYLYRVEFDESALAGKMVLLK